MLRAILCLVCLMSKQLPKGPSITPLSSTGATRQLALRLWEGGRPFPLCQTPAAPESISEKRPGSGVRLSGCPSAPSRPRRNDFNVEATELTRSQPS